MDSDAEERRAKTAIGPFVGRTDYPLTVVTALSPEGEPSGCLAGFVTQCSIAPPRLLICISTSNHTFDVARRASGLAVHLLGGRQQGMASLFGEETGDVVDKFARCDWRRGATDAPLLVDCAAWVEGRVEARIPLGDHVAFVIRPVDGGTGRNPGLLTYRGAPDFRPGHPAD